jgi:hypothetical protein
MTFTRHPSPPSLATPHPRVRRRQRRRGSILIMVVAILVLLALMGTAFISTARIDRQNADLTDPGPPIDQVKKIAETAILNDLLGTASGYRLAQDAVTDTAYEHFDAFTFDPILGAPRDKWLGARLPELIDVDVNNTVATGDDLIGVPAWIATSDAAQAFVDIETDQTLIFDQSQRYAFIPTAKSIVYTTTPAQQPKEFPAFRVVRYNTTVTPARWQGATFVATNPAPNSWAFVANANDWRKYVAADADGDGIADSRLFRVPGPTVNGTTYYGALRIIDNGSAINVNTAWSNVTDFGTTIAQRRDAFGTTITAPPATLGFFPSHVGLMQILSDYGAASPDTSAQMQALTPFRLGNAANASLVPVSGPTPVETATGRTDFTFNTQGEAFFYQSIGRTRNPSYNATSGDLYQPLDPKLNNGSLGYRFLQIDPETNTDPENAGAYSSPPLPLPPPTTKYPYHTTPAEVDKYLGPSVYATAFNHVGVDTDNAFTVYPANGVANWFDWNFNFTDAAGANARVFNEYDASPDDYPSAYESTTPPLFRPLRSLLTASNPVSNYTPSFAAAPPRPEMLPYAQPANYASGTYATGSFVTRNNPAPGNQPVVYRYLETATATPAPVPTDTATNLDWARESWTATPTKASLNTAGFGQLYRTFWQVMSGPTAGTTPFDTYITERLGDTPPAQVLGSTPRTLNDPYVGNKFAALTPFTADATVDPGMTAPAVGPPHKSYEHPARMFRSSLRALPLATTGGFDSTAPRFTSVMQMYLRAALAAVNAEDQRDSDDSVTYRDVSLTMTNTATSGGAVVETPVVARVYGNERQPYITEVYVQTDTVTVRAPATGPNPIGYVAIELYNPHSVAIDISNCRIAAISRSNATLSYSAGATPKLITMTNIVPTLTTAVSNAPAVYGATGVVIPPRGYVVLENYNPTTSAPNDAKYRPAATGLPATGPIVSTVVPPAVDAKNYVYVGNLEAIIGVGSAIASRELVLLRPLEARAPLTAITGTPAYPAGTTMVQYFSSAVGTPPPDDQLVPLDQFDFTGLPPGTTANAYAWHYARQSAMTGSGWRFVYPGRYNAGTAFSDTSTPLPSPRHQGVRTATWPLPGGTDPWTAPPPPPPALPVTPVVSLAATPPTVATAAASYPVTFPISLASNEATAMQALRAPAAGVNRFPFGGFARVGDVLNVPFIGAYRIDTGAANASDLTPTVYELNSITMDAAMAEDTDTATDSFLTTPAVPAWATGTDYRAGDRVTQGSNRYVALVTHESTATDSPAVATAPTAGARWQLDAGPLNVLEESVGKFVPVVIGSRTDLGTSTGGVPLTDGGGSLRYGWATDLFDHFTAIQNPQDDYLPNVLPRNYRYQTAAGVTYFTASPEAVANKKGTRFGDANSPGEADAPIEGLINVNTAPAKVLAALPWTESQTVNANIAASIVAYRNTASYAPFRSLYDLARVPYLTTTSTVADIWAGSRGVVIGVADALSTDGDLAADALAGDNVLGDAKERLLTLTRVSNLITTRSDTFTVYAVVQGWLNAGTAAPELDKQIRAAFTTDRSAAVGPTPTVTSTEIPVE